MPRTCLAFAFALTALIAVPSPVPAQPNSEKASQVSGPSPEPPAPPKAVKDSLKAARAKAKKAKAAAAADTAKPAAVPTPAAGASAGTAPVSDTASKAAAPAVAAPAADSARPSAADTAQAESAATDTVKTPETVAEAKPAPQRAPQDLRLFNDRRLVAKEYGFGVLFSVVSGTLGFFIGSGIETAIRGESEAHKGTLSFTGIRYDNFQGAFWGGSTGLVLGSALSTYFTGQLDEEDGGFLATLAGTTATAAGAFYLASLMGVNDEIDWKPFLPLLVVPSIGGTLGFNLSRWLHDRERERVVGKEAAVRWHAPSLAWGLAPGGERVELRALRLTF